MSTGLHTGKERERTRRGEPLRYNQELNNPCLKEHHSSLKCLGNNYDDHSQCKLYFENYNICKEFWGNLMMDRRHRGISPLLPPPEEREKIKADYLNSLKRN